jgi:hypothetical protein
MSNLASLKQKINKLRTNASEKIEEVNRDLAGLKKLSEKTSFLVNKGSQIHLNPGGKRPEPQKPVDLTESAPLGTFERLEEDLRAALNEDCKDIFKQNQSCWCILMYAFPEKVIVSCDNKYYEITYSIDIKGEVTWGTPKEVEQLYVPAPSDVKEAAGSQTPRKTVAQEIKESGIAITKEAVDMDLDVAECVSLKEAKYDPNTGEVEVILIESGTNPLKKRHYPESTIREAAPGFSGLKMFLNHPTKKEEQEMPERDITKWASTIVESFCRDVVLTEATGQRTVTQAVGRVAVHDSWLRERLQDPVARQHIGVSINTGGKVSYGKVNGEEMQIVEKIVLARANGPATVDWVTEAGARGRVSKLLKESQTKEKTMDLKEATFEDLKRENPSLVECVRKSVMDSDEIKKTGTELAEANKRLAALEIKEKQGAQASKVLEMLKESKLPEIVKTRISKKLGEKVYENEKDLKEAFDGVHKEELELVNQLSPKGKIKMGTMKEGQAAGDSDAVKSATTGLMERMGIKEEKKEEDEK